MTPIYKVVSIVYWKTKFESFQAGWWWWLDLNKSSKNGPTLVCFVYFRSFQTQILQKKTVDVSGIRTWIVRVEGKHADHLTATVYLNKSYPGLSRSRRSRCLSPTCRCLQCSFQSCAEDRC